MCWGSIRQLGRTQHKASSKVEYQLREELFVHMGPSHRAQVRSQAGPGATHTMGWRSVTESSWTQWHPSGSWQRTPTVQWGPCAGRPWVAPARRRLQRNAQQERSLTKNKNNRTVILKSYTLGKSGQFSPNGPVTYLNPSLSSWNPSPLLSPHPPPPSLFLPSSSLPNSTTTTNPPLEPPPSPLPLIPPLSPLPSPPLPSSSSPTTTTTHTHLPVTPSPPPRRSPLLSPTPPSLPRHCNGRGVASLHEFQSGTCSQSIDVSIEGVP